jgi:signal transduction histidine kinase
MSAFFYIYTILIGVYTALALYHTMVYLGRRSDKANLYYSVLLLSCVYITFTKGILPELKGFDTLPLHHFKIFAQYSASAFAISTMIAFVYKALKIVQYRKWILSYITYMVVLITICYIWYIMTEDSRGPVIFITALALPLGASLWFLMLKTYFAKKNYCYRNFSKTLIAIASAAYCASYVIFPIMFVLEYSQAIQLLVITIGMLIMAIVSAYALVNTFNKEHHELIDTKEHLESKVIERTKELEAVNNHRTTAFVNVAHEIKTPLTILNNLVNIYIKKYGNNSDLKEIKNWIEILIKEAVIFLDVEKFTMGKILYENEKTINLSELLIEKIDSFKTYIEESCRITLKSGIEKNICIKADPFAIDRVMNNLIINAVKYNKTDGIISVELQKKGEFAEIIVSDTGVGISHEHIGRIFEQYYQASHIKNNRQGIGMGLYITNQIIKSLDGSIDVESELGKGSIFRIKLKCTYDNVKKEKYDLQKINITESKQKVTDYYSNNNSITILIVEDNISLLKTIRENLKQSYNVFCATNGYEAVEKIDNTNINPDIIISDVMMDVMDGYELLSIIRSRKNNVPFIFLTAKTGINEEIKGLNSGAIDYIQKPFHMDILKARIETLISYNKLKESAFELEKYRSMGMLTASICHEILNPLTGIKGSFEVVEDIVQYNQDNLLQEGIDNVKTNIRRISDIVTTLRCLFHGDRIITEKLNLLEIIELVIALYKDNLGSKIEFKINVDTNIFVLANKSALTQVLVNLVTNAAEAIEETGVIYFDYANNKLIIGDNGCGIAENNLKNIYNISFSTKREKGCTGIGLFIVKEISDRMGIDIKIESVLDEGTTVHLTFPNK